MKPGTQHLSEDDSRHSFGDAWLRGRQGDEVCPGEAGLECGGRDRRRLTSQGEGWWWELQRREGVFEAMKGFEARS